MVIYIDSNYCCHVSNPTGELRAIETDFFDGKCDRYIEGYLFVPDGERWVRDDGTVFYGEMISASVDYSILKTVQEQYEEDQEQMADMAQALEILGVNP